MISVCIATYNGEQYIKEQLLSILNQISDDDEVIISDDYSTDNTTSIIEAIGDNRIKLFFHKKDIIVGRSISHRYATFNFENALKYAKGDYIFLADQDDVWLPNKLSVMFQSLQNNFLVFSNFSIIDKQNKLHLHRYYTKNPISVFTVLNLIKMPFYGCCMAFRRELLNVALPFPENLIVHDNWLGLLALKLGKVEFIDTPLILYRRHSSNVSQSTNNKSLNPLVYKIQYRISLYKQILKRLK